MNESVSRIGQSCYKCFGRGYESINWMENNIEFCKCIRGIELRSIVTRINWNSFNEGFQKCVKHLLSLNDIADPTQRVFTDQALAAIKNSPTRNSS